MKIVDRHLVERQGVALVQSLTVTDLHWLFREQPVSDFGIDAHLEIAINGRATGRLLALQIKSGESYFRESVAQGFVYRGDREHLEYWLQHALPVVIVICKPGTQEAYWQVVSETTVVKTDGNWKMIMPSAQRFNADSVGHLQEIAAARATSLEGQGILGGAGALTHPDSILGALLANSDLLIKGRCEIETSSVVYTCSRIATLDNLLAVLVSTTWDTEGTVLVMQQIEDRWNLATQVPVRTKFADSLPAFFVPGESTRCLVVQYPTMWGTGTLMIEERWYALSKEPRLILRFPVTAYVFGWGLVFDREIKGVSTGKTAKLSPGAHVDVRIDVRYSPNSDVPKYQGVEALDINSTIRLEWQEVNKTFSLLPGSDIAPDEAFDLYGEDDGGFVRRNLNLLLTLVDRRNEGMLTCLMDLAEKANPEQRQALQRALEKTTT